MSSTKKTITIPSNVGSNQLAETFGKITLSSEVKELLSALDAEIYVRYIPGADKPVISVKTGTGQTMCSLEEFKALSGYRRFVSDALKEVEKKTSTTEKIKLIGYYLRLAVMAGKAVPGRVLEQNLTKFNQVGSSIQLVKNHMEVIGETVDNEWKDYLLENGQLILRVLYTTQLECMGADIVSRDYIGDALFNVGTPKWVYTRFLDKNFTSNLKDDSITLLFPKNNYLKAAALSTKELREESFLTQNRILLGKSGGIIALARADFSALFPAFADDVGEQIQEYLEKYQWVLTSPYTSDTILTHRETGKSPPIFREAQPPRKAGQNQRPESEVARTCRLIGNVLGKIQATWNGIMNFVIPVANPKTSFWGRIFANAENWEITPTNSIYNLIRNEATALTVLDNIRNATSANVLALIGEIVSQVLMVPHGTSDNTLIVNVFGLIHNRQAFVQREDTVDNTAAYIVADLAALEVQPPTEPELVSAKSFLGIRETRAGKKKKKSGAGAVRLHTKVLNELGPLKELALYEPAVDWLSQTFKTGLREKLQLVAAERILGEALKHQETIFEDEFEEDELFTIEEYYEDE